MTATSKKSYVLFTQLQVLASTQLEEMHLHLEYHVIHLAPCVFMIIIIFIYLFLKWSYTLQKGTEKSQGVPQGFLG